MKVDHFSSEFGGCMEEALKKAAQWEVEKVVPASAASVDRALAGAAAPGRDAPGRRRPRVAATPANARALRRDDHADPEMKADAISHLQSLQDEISKAMKSLQQAAS
ncbi:hypothetical protein JL720_4843 [Aureococcus anophagefferens]|nr:hypothetical protein JL720_4843 [Aureococcus anophagefferens]